MAIKITNDMQSVREQTDYNRLFLELCEKYRNVFITEIDDEIFIYKALGRKAYREILSDTRLDNFKKEEALCIECILHPVDYDWGNCPAGVPTQLVSEILKNSYLDNMESRNIVKSYYRAEMFDLDNQITCIIQEAFPNFDIEEIEEWDIERTMKYLSRAEWKLTNLHGLKFKEPEGEFFDPTKNDTSQEKTATKKKRSKTAPKKDPDKTIRGGSKKDKLTPEKINADKERERAEFFRKFPEFAGRHDDGLDGIKGLEQSDVDPLPPALRPGF